MSKKTKKTNAHSDDHKTSEESTHESGKEPYSDSGEQFDSYYGD